MSLTAEPVPSVLVSGNTTLDIITVCDARYNKSGKRPVAQYKQLPGGQAANVADLLANFGNAVSFVGAIGHDFAGKAIKEDFAKTGIEILHSAFCDAPHHLGFVRVDKSDGERFIDMYKDPALTCDDLMLDERWVAGFDCIYLDNHEPELAIRLARLGRSHNVPVICDLEEITKHSNSVLKNTDVLIAPEQIIQEIGHSDDTPRAVQAALESGFAAVIATMGVRGCFGICQNEAVQRASISVPVADTTGAGDAFHGAFVHSMLMGYGFRDCMIVANEIAAKKCEFLGPRIPTHQAKPIKPPRKNAYVKNNWRRNQLSMES